ncbi:MAG: 3D domain-containing protein [Spirochaetota bacterium]
MSARVFNILAATFVVFLLTAIQGSQSVPLENYSLQSILDSDIFKECEKRAMQCELTAYCPGQCCNSAAVVYSDGTKGLADWSNRIAAGDASIDELGRAGIGIAAVDRAVIPYGSIIRYNGRLYAALDCGGMIKGTCIDICVPSHAEADRFGRRTSQNIDVFVPSDPALSVKAIVRRALPLK